VRKKEKKHYRDCLKKMKLMGGSCFRGALGLKNEDPARCESEFKVQILKCTSDSCINNATGKHEEVKVFTSHVITGNTKESQHPSCSVWFSFADLMMRTAVANLRHTASMPKVDDEVVHSQYSIHQS